MKELVEELKEKGQSKMSGKDAFQLYDTYGFPLELTEEVVEEENITINYKEFDAEMQKQRERARLARQTENSMAVQTSLLNEVTVKSTFIGYNQDETTTTLIKIIKDEAFVEEIEPGESARLLFEESPFYAEKGGQVGDTGLILNEDKTVMAEILNVKSGPEGQPIHDVKVRKNE